MTETNFINELKKISIEITQEQLEKLNRYYELLVEWNEKINLTSITLKEDVYLKHFYDSITLSKIINLNDVNTLCDVGTGAGFPGLVIKIMFPNIKVTLVDALEKRIKFLNIVIEELGLTDIETVHARSEDYAKLNRNKFDVTTARAVAHLSTLLEYCIPMTKVGSYFIAMKANIDEELEESKNAQAKLFVSLEKREEFNLINDNGLRNILLFKKHKDNILFPRKYAEIKKNRL